MVEGREVDFVESKEGDRSRLVLRALRTRRMAMYESRMVESPSPREVPSFRHRGATYQLFTFRPILESLQ